MTYELTEGSIKESIIVSAAPGETGAAAWSFWLVVDGEGAVPVVTETGAVEIRKPDGSVVFGIPKPYAYDSAGVAGQRERGSITQTGSRQDKKRCGCVRLTSPSMDPNRSGGVNDAKSGSRAISRRCLCS